MTHAPSLSEDSSEDSSEDRPDRTPEPEPDGGSDRVRLPAISCPLAGTSMLLILTLDWLVIRRLAPLRRFFG
ncbi:hypothetical protein ACGF4C_26890 [Streptomyces sp. NPDC048197]|uniref:hypothetical protein n=1 Tax=Streptomyces sp. NPDC048197 TaxID=3365511 RepID=UPI00371103DA